MYIEILLALFGVLLYRLYQKRKRQFQFFKKLGIPGPEPNIFFGNLLEIVRKGSIRSQTKWVKTYGKVMGYYYGTKPVLLVTDLDLLKNVLIKDFQKFSDRPFVFREIFNTVLSKDRTSMHLLNLKGKNWKDIRSLVTPSFTSSKMKLMSPIMNNCIDILLETIEKKRLSGEPFEMHALFKGLTIDVIINTAFGVQTNVQQNPNDRFVKLATFLFSAPLQWLHILMIGSFSVFSPLFSFLRNISVVVAQRAYNPVEELLDTCEAIIKQRMKDPSETIAERLLDLFSLQQCTDRHWKFREKYLNISIIYSHHNNELLKRMDLLQLLIDAEIKGDNVRDEALTAGEESEKQDVNNVNAADATMDQKKKRLTIDQMVGNAFLFFIAGFETTSTALAFCTMMFVNYPDVQEKIRAEVNDLLEKEGKLDYGSINQLEYLDQVFCEILRLYPPVYQLVNREAMENVVYDNIRIPKGTIVHSPAYLLHYDSDYWPNPQEFKPERFSPENRKKNNPLAWQPFGAGPRNCVGMRFAQMEAKLAIAKILHKYRLLPTEKTDQHPLNLHISPAIIRPKYGVPIKVEKV